MPYTAAFMPWGSSAKLGTTASPNPTGQYKTDDPQHVEQHTRWYNDNEEAVLRIRRTADSTSP
uniref:Uncharacterized protein n=1 Tax=Setaria digitata TaxID=48799 RepID=A0A915PC22_9BILA